MNKYPFVYLLRDDKYNEIDCFFEKNKDKLNCTVEIISVKEIEKLNNMFNSNYHLLVTYSTENKEQYIDLVSNQIVDRIKSRWIHKEKITDVKEFNEHVNYCYIDNVIMKREKTRPIFSIFTTCYKSYDKIKRAYSGLVTQSLRDWEWVILDDSPEDEHFDFLRNFCKKDKRIRLYKRDSNSGSIGNVKNEVVGLCRGKDLLELDHDDIILSPILEDAYNIFEGDDDIGFVYSDFFNMYEDGRDFSYKISSIFGKGYCGYYKQKFNNGWRSVCVTPGINNITTSHLVCLPNHPRIWRKKTLIDLENYSEFLPICDDFEILMRTMCNTKIAKIHKAGYIQFMNDNENNFSLIRNNEINRLGPCHIQPQFYNMYDVNKIMKDKDAYEDEKWINRCRENIWKRNNNWEHKVCNITLNPDFDKQYCLLGIDSLYDEKIKEAYKNRRNDFILLSNTETTDDIINGQWHHVALVLNGSTSIQDDALTMYLDGELVSTVQGSQLWQHLANINVGKNGNTRFKGGSDNSSGEYFYGSIDEFRIWNVARSSQNIALYKDSFLNGNETELTTYFDFEDQNADDVQTFDSKNNGTISSNSVSF